MKKRRLILASLCSLLGIAGGHAQNSGDYLIQNVETGYYLGGGNGWGTRATLLGKPQWFTLTSSGTGYTLDSHQHNSADAHFLTASQYVDGAATEWTLTESSTGVYTIANAGNYLAGNGTNQPTTTVTDATNAAAQWRLISRGDLDTQLASATIASPVDATALIKNPEFKRNANTQWYPTWMVTAADGTGTPGNLAYGSNSNNANCAESWHSNNGFRLVQTLSGIPAGTYRLDAQAFYRQDGTDNTSLPYVFLGTEQAIFPRRTGTENAMTGAYAAFLAKKYPTEPLYVRVEAGGTVDLGVHGPVNNMLWNIWGEFGLTYYGDVSVNEVKLATYIAAYQTALAAAQAYQTQPMAQADLDALNAAITANTLNISTATQDQLVASASALNAAATAAAKAVVKQQNATAAAAKLANGDYNFTEFIVNPSFEMGNLTGWSSEQGGNPANNGNFGAASGSWFTEKWIWSGSAANTLANGSLLQTIQGLPAGTYKLTAAMQNLQQGDANVVTGGYFLTANSTRTEASASNTYSVTFDLAEGADLTLGAVIDGCTGNWVCVDNFTLTYMPTQADATDYANLAAAISAAESKTQGFNIGQYAPYTNAAAIQALTAAKAIDPSVANGQADVQAATAALSAATWTPNTTLMNAIYDGTLAEKTVSVNSGEANAQMTQGGWTANSGFRLILGNATTYPALAQTTDGRAVFSWTGTYVYGEQPAYTIPLEANTQYALCFKYAGWNGQVNNVTVSVLNHNNEGLSPQNLGSAPNGPQTAGAFKTAFLTFTSGAAGNYVLRVGAGGNFSLADISLYKFQEITLNDADAALPATAPLARVNYERTLFSGWNSIVLPFATSLSELGADKAYAFDGTTPESDGTYTVKLVGTTELKAHTPYIVHLDTDNTVHGFLGKSVSAPATPPVATDESGSAFEFTGVYSALAKGNSAIRQGDYIVGENGFKRASGGNKLNAYRAYLKNLTSGAGIKGFTIDGDTPTAIEALELESALTGEAIYNLNGQRVQQPKQGIYIVGSRKVVVR